MEERKVPGKNELRKREPVIQVKNLYKVYRVGRHAGIRTERR